MDPKPLLTEYLDQNFLDWFWGRVEKTNTCWYFHGIHGNRRGQVNVGGRAYRVSRIAFYSKTHIDPYPLDICHTCDDTICVYTEHLFAGTALDNTRDMLDKGRGKKARGESSGVTHLTEIDVANIRWLLANNYTQKSIGEQYGVSEPCIQSIGKRRNWKYSNLVIKPDWV